MTSSTTPRVRRPLTLTLTLITAPTLALALTTAQLHPNHTPTTPSPHPDLTLATPCPGAEIARQNSLHMAEVREIWGDMGRHGEIWGAHPSPSPSPNPNLSPTPNLNHNPNPNPNPNHSPNPNRSTSPNCTSGPYQLRRQERKMRKVTASAANDRKVTKLPRPEP